MGARCQLAGSASESLQSQSVNSTAYGTSPAYMASQPQTEDPARQVANIGRKVTQIVATQEQVTAQLKQIHLLLVLVICLLILLIFIVFVFPPQCSSSHEHMVEIQNSVENQVQQDDAKSEL